jgi:hypothetical protein
MRIMFLGDLHAPWILWEVLQAAADFAEEYKPDLIVQVGDLIDAKMWSKHPKDPDDCASIEWGELEISLERVHKLFPELTILSGNHDRRIMNRANDVSLPHQLVKSLKEAFPYKGWTWHVDGSPLIADGIRIIHGDETLGNAWQKAQRMGECVAQGHDHMAYLQYVNTFDRQIWGMSVGTFMDGASAAGRYAARNPFRCWHGWATATNGVPALHPYDLRVKKTVVEKQGQAVSKRRVPCGR